VKEDILHFISLAIFLVVISVFVFISSLSNLVSINEQQKYKFSYQKLLTMEQAQKNAGEKALIKTYLLGKFNPAKNKYFAVVPEDYGISGYTMYLRKETLNAFLQMAEAAEKDGVELRVASATRNFDYQENLWDNKWTGAVFVDGKNLAKSVPDGLQRFKTILEYSSAPGSSRHHWGTDIDINNANVEYFKTEYGEKVYDWMEQNAASFGFCQPYIAKGTSRPTGYEEEKWHWSYTPLSKTFVEEYKNYITADDIKGFDGDEYVSQLNLINDYVLGINPECF
jgi:LAS superfamily LD-carboxypeptidase LdcB